MIIISQLSSVPIYEQISNGIKELILKGTLKSGDKLPSIRVMAKDLKVGIITVNRAYEDLGRDGYITNIQGRGCFINELQIDKIKEINKSEIGKEFEKIVDEALVKGIEKEEIIELFLEICGRR